jgi:uncharacterized cupredoxin-like copper-binding protein
MTQREDFFGAPDRTLAMRHATRARSLTLAALALLLFPACSSTPSVPAGLQDTVTLHDFHISAPVNHVEAGSVVLHIHNDSPSTHEFVLVRTDLPAGRLPIATNGLTVNEDALHSMGENSQIDAGTTGTLALNLPAGRYVFFCNLEGHYMGGMHGVLEVTG